MTQIVRDPSLYEPNDEDLCTVFGYFCHAHDCFYLNEACTEEPHLIALDCQDHGPESVWPQPLMLMFPEGFDPPLSDAQLAWAEAGW
ncbi:hypothetical protein ACWGHM_42630 [Streptomyces sp. NPDC054904]